MKNNFENSQSLTWNALVSALETNNIRVSVIHGTVMLSGTVCNYARKQAVEKAAGAVPGIKNIVNEIEVKTPGQDQSDIALAQAVTRAVREAIVVPESGISLHVEDNWLKVEGEADLGNGKKARVSYPVCRLNRFLADKSTARFSVLNDEEEVDYWEIFGQH